MYLFNKYKNQKNKMNETEFSPYEQELLRVPTPHDELAKMYYDDRMGQPVDKDHFFAVLDKTERDIYGAPDHRLAGVYEEVVGKQILSPNAAIHERSDPTFVVELLDKFPIPHMLDGAVQVARDTSIAALEDEMQQGKMSPMRAEATKDAIRYLKQQKTDERYQAAFEDFKKFLYGDRYEASLHMGLTPPEEN